MGRQSFRMARGDLGGGRQSPTTEGDPVKVSSLKRGSVVNRSAPSRAQGSTLKAPLGRWGALVRISAMMSAPMGVREAGLSTKGHLQRKTASGLNKYSLEADWAGRT